MAKRVKNASMTLKDFYDKAPGHAPFENRLPSKPGMPKNGGYLDSTDVESVESRFSDMSMGPHGGYDSTNGSPFKGNGFPPQSALHSPGPMGLGGFERSIWLPQQPAAGYHDEYAGYGWKHSPSSSFGDTFSMGSGDLRASGFRQPPPPPPRSQPNVGGAAGHSLQGWTEQPRRAEAQNAFSKDGREEDSFHYDVRQLGPPPAVKLPQAMQPEAPGQTWRASAAPGGGRDSGAPVSGERPRLQLQPRSKPLPEGIRSQPAAPVEGHRPRLQLQPRSKPLCDQQGRTSSIFGETRPREDILKERGVNPIAADLGLPAAAPGAAPQSIPAATAPPALRRLAVHQEESEWQTVGTRRNRHGDSSPAAASYLAGENPLLSHTAQTAPRGVMYPDGAHAPYGSSYYQQGTHGSMFGAGPLFWAEPADDSGSDFPGRRGLPTRQDDLF